MEIQDFEDLMKLLSEFETVIKDKNQLMIFYKFDSIVYKLYEEEKLQQAILQVEYQKEN